MEGSGSSELSAIWRRDGLPQTVRALAARCNEGAIRTCLTDLLRHGFGVQPEAIDHEVRLPEVHGRADALIGAAVFEIKSDPRRELADAEQQVHRYLAQREASTGRRFLGIATGGAIFTKSPSDNNRMRSGIAGGIEGIVRARRTYIDGRRRSCSEWAT